jgi:hypothetical protein
VVTEYMQKTHFSDLILWNRSYLIVSRHLDDLVFIPVSVF